MMDKERKRIRKNYLKQRRRGRVHAKAIKTQAGLYLYTTDDKVVYKSGD